MSFAGNHGISYFPGPGFVMVMTDDMGQVFVELASARNVGRRGLISR
jgi:hypothetical protein